MPPAPDDFKELVRSRTDLVSLIGESLSLTPQRGGNEYVGLCPFHEDHNPSMRVYPDRQTWRCWVCDEGGDCYSWVMKKDGLGFREALEMLAERAHLEIPKHVRQQGSEAGPKKIDQYDILTWAETEFHRCLLEHAVAAPAREYLHSRGFTAETIAKFRLGYHPNDWNWLLDRARNRYSPAQLLAVRLVGERSNGPGFYDNFVDRLMFPIRDERSRTVAFGGRVLPGNTNPDLPKYWNSPESALFVKSRTLYGLDAAREAFRQAKTVAVVEGYTDCIMCHQYGVPNVVATLGTALTETHVTALKRFVRKVVLIYDGDDAGRMAAERALVKLLAQDIDLRVLTLPGGQDPAEFLAAEGADAFRTRIEQAAEAWEFKLRAAIERYGTTSIDGRHQVAEQMLELLSRSPRMAGTVREDIILSRIAGRLQVAEQTLRQRLADIRKKNAGSNERSAAATHRIDAPAETHDPFRANSLTRDQLIEAELLEIVFTAPQTVEQIRKAVPVEEIGQKHFRELLSICYELSGRGIEPTLERVTTELEDSDLKRAAVWIDVEARRKAINHRLNDTVVKNGSESQTYLEQVIETLVWRRLKQTHERSQGQLAQMTDAPSGLDQDAKALLRQATEFHRKRAQKKTLT